MNIESMPSIISRQPVNWHRYPGGGYKAVIPAVVINVLPETGLVLIEFINQFKQTERHWVDCKNVEPR